MAEAGPTAANAPASGLPLEGHRAIVTGCAHGIGRGIALAVAAAGADVAGVDLDPSESDTESGIRELGRRAIMLSGDTGDPATIERVADAAVSEWGGVDVWVNNAARLMVKPILETTDDDWHGLLAANLHGAGR